MDQRVLATVVVGLWLADCSPVESHPLCASCVDAAVFFALRCRVASPLCLRRLVVLAVACSVECSSRCVAVPLSSVCPRRRVCCARRRCCSLASWPLLLRCCAHTPCHACCCVRRRCSDAMFFALRCRLEWFARPMHAPCVPVVPCPCPVAGCGWGVGVGAVVTQWPGCLPPPWGAPLPCGLPRGWGCFLVGIKITPGPSSWKVDGVGVHFMLTNSIHPGVTVALPAAPTTSALDLAGRGSASRAGLRA